MLRGVNPAPAEKSDSRSDVLADVARSIQAEARLNELRVAVVRVVAYGLVLALDAVLAALGTRPAGNLVQSGVLVTISLVVLLALRRVSPPAWSRYAIPLLDASMIGFILTNRLAAQGLTTGLAATIALSCALFAITGTLRFHRRSAAWTTGFAGALLLFLLQPMKLGAMLYALNALFAVGFLSMWLTDQVRRSVEGVGRSRMLQRFLPPELMATSEGEAAALLGEPRAWDATVLVSDLRGFTSLSESVSPPKLFAFLNECQGAFAQAVQQHGGRVDKFMGDGMLAVFGVSSDAPDHAARALEAAHAIRAAVRKLNARATLGDAEIRIGIGIHSGALLAGCLGSGDRLEFTVIGDTVNVASRLEALTKTHGVDVLVSDETVRRLGDHDLDSLGEVPIRGRVKPLVVYTLDEVTGSHPFVRARNVSSG